MGALNRSVEPSRRITSTATAVAVLGSRDKIPLTCRCWLVLDRLGGQDDLQGVRLRSIAEDVVGTHRVAEREVMRYTDVCDPSTGTHELGAELEGLGQADCLDGDIRPE